MTNRISEWNYYSLLILFLIVTSGYLNLISAQNTKSCETCMRHGQLTEFENLHSTDYEQKLKEWQECMLLHSGGFTSLDTSNANVRKALEECSGLNPGNRWHCDMSTMSTYIGERFSNQCFHQYMLTSLTCHDATVESTTLFESFSYICNSTPQRCKPSG